MRRLLLTAAGMALLSAAACAAENIPARYSGKFPSDGIRTNITGTHTAKRLTVRFKRAAGRRALRRTGNEPLPSQVRICPVDRLLLR
jgi:hypothetical protein